MKPKGCAKICTLLIALHLASTSLSANISTQYDVKAIAQSNSMSCWAAAAAMLMSWKTGIQQTDFQAASAAGTHYKEVFQSQSGLFGSDIAGFAKALHMIVEQPQNFTPEGYNKLLAKFGPLWIGTAIFSPDHVYKHVRVIRGISWDGTPDNSNLIIIDPDGGREYTETVTQFARELEAIAKADLGQGASLTPQIIHNP
jgi:hypothetical protein